MDKKKEIATIATITDINEIPEEVKDKRVKEEEIASKFISGGVLNSPPRTWSEFGYDVGANTVSGIGRVVRDRFVRTATAADAATTPATTTPATTTTTTTTTDAAPANVQVEQALEGDSTVDRSDGSTAPDAATAVQICPTTIGIRRLLNRNNKIERDDSKTSYNTIMNAVLPDREEKCTYPNILKDYVGLKRKFNKDFESSFNKLTGQNIETVADEIDKMLVELYKREGTSGPLHELGNQEGFRVGGKKKGGSKKNKVEKKKERKTKRKYYIKKKKGNSKKNKKSKAKRNTRRK